jgi:exonuclease VII large subunit
MLETLSYQGTLNRGYVVVRDKDDKPLTNPEAMQGDQDYALEFAGEKRVSVKTKNS